MIHTALDVLADPILPVFAILALGYGLGRAGWMALDEARLINRFAVTILIPIILFDLLANAPFETYPLAPFLIYVGVQGVIFAIGYLLARRVFGIAPGEAVILGYAGIFANNVFYALPIAVLIYGDSELLPITIIVILDSTVSLAGTMIALQAIEKGQVSAKVIFDIFARTPALLAILAGLAVGFLDLGVPEPVQTFLDFNGSAAAPVALFALGVVLSDARFGPDPAVAAVVAIKIFVFPAAIALAIWSADPAGWSANRLFVFGSAGPVGAVAFSLAIFYNVPTDRLAQVLVWTFLLSLFTLAVLA
ncbi:MAG: AEC family transporter [Pseudomonadota bacterium]